MKPADLRALSVDELTGRAKSIVDELFQLRLQKAMGQLEAPRKIRDMRRDLARVKTMIREKTTE